MWRPPSNRSPTPTTWRSRPQCPEGTERLRTLIIGTDITSALQAAVTGAAAAHQPLWINSGTYMKTAAISLPASNCQIRGESRLSVNIVHASSTTDSFDGVDTTGVALVDFTTTGPGQGVGTGNGINLTISAAPATFYPQLRRVAANSFGVDGIAVATPIAWACSNS